MKYTDLEGWHRLDEHELALGASDAHERLRVKVVPRDEMIAISRGETSGASGAGSDSAAASGASALPVE